MRIQEMLIVKKKQGPAYLFIRSMESFSIHRQRVARIGASGKLIGPGGGPVIAKTIFVIGLFCFYSVANATEENQRCKPETASDAKLYSTDLRWEIPFVEMMSLYRSIYSSKKRLPKRAYFDEATGTYKLPFAEGFGGDIPISENFIATIRHHVETGMARGYVDALFFSDMGHSHIFIPESKYESTYKSIPINEMTRFYRLLFEDPEIKILYHTAEQLKFTAEPHVQWRFYTRNLIGENRQDGDVYVLPAVEHRANTLRDLDGHRLWNTGFHISASEAGCFPYMERGQIRYFDLSLYDLQPEGTMQPFSDQLTH